MGRLCCVCNYGNLMTKRCQNMEFGKGIEEKVCQWAKDFEIEKTEDEGQEEANA